MLEAKDSSEIENIVTTTDQLFRYSENEASADWATKEALRYRTALREGYLQLKDRPLCVNTAIDICSKLKNKLIDIRKIPGTIIASTSTNKSIYTPPVGENIIREMLANWEKYLHHNDDIDPLIKMAIAHYQFESIHPFLDGNGRTGRILNILYLIEKKLLDLPILYMSHFIVKNKSEYYRLLLHVTRNQAWEPWILFILKAVEQTAGATNLKIKNIITLMTQTITFIKTNLPKIYSRELVEVIFEQPYCRIHNLVNKDVAKRQTASVYLKSLCDIGVLEEKTAGKEKLFINPRLMQVLHSDRAEFMDF